MLDRWSESGAGNSLLVKITVSSAGTQDTTDEPPNSSRFTRPPGVCQHRNASSLGAFAFLPQGGLLTERGGLASAPPITDRPRPPIVIADPALVERLEQGVCVSGDRSRIPRGTLSLMALGLVQHRGWQMEKVAHQSPCRSFELKG